MTRFNALAGITVSALALSAGMAVGATKTWVGGTMGALTEWNEDDNWSPSGVPVANDDIVVPDVTHQPVFDGSGAAANYDSLVLQSSAEMTISGAEFVINESNTGTSLAVNAGAILRLTGTDPILSLETPMNVDVAGSNAQILTDASSTDAIVSVDAAATFNISSGGQIVLDGNPPTFRVRADTTLTTPTGVGTFVMNEGSKIEIAANVELTNALSVNGGIVGQGSIDGNAGFPNNGKLINDSVVKASGGSTAILMLTSTLLVEDTDDNDAAIEWIATDAATLSFLRSLSNLNGDFELPDSSDGVFRFHENVDVVTKGNFFCVDGEIMIDDNASFRFDDDGMGGGTTIDDDCNCGSSPLCAES